MAVDIKYPVHNRIYKGFSLIEISIVIIIISIILSLAIPIGSAKQESENISETRRRLNTISVAIAAYVGTNNSLPCPARINASRNTANFGAATTCSVAAVAGVTNVTSGPNNIRIGGVPIKALNLPESYANDTWGRRFTYVVDVALSTGVGTMATSGSINITDANNNTLTVPASTGAYFIFSSGQEGKGGYDYNGANPVRACGTTAKDSENCDGDFQFVDTAYNDGTIAANFFDDLVVWRTNTLGGNVVTSVLPNCTNGQSIVSNGSGGYLCMNIPPICASGQMIVSSGSGNYVCTSASNPTGCSGGRVLTANGSGGWSCTIPSTCGAGQMLVANGSGNLVCATVTSVPSCPNGQTVVSNGAGGYNCAAYGTVPTCGSGEMLRSNGSGYTCITLGNSFGGGYYNSGGGGVPNGCATSDDNPQCPPGYYAAGFDLCATNQAAVQCRPF